MFRFLAVVLCAVSLFAVSSPAQVSNSTLEPIRVQPGSILAFHLQTRLRPNAADPLDGLPQGTVFHVKILTPIDSSTDRDGSEFHGSVVSDLSLGDGVVIHADSEVRGLFVLLRSKSHPEGFRYELLLTELVDHGKAYPLTASLNSSFYDASAQASPSSPSSETKADSKELPKANVSANTKFTVVSPE